MENPEFNKGGIISALIAVVMNLYNWLSVDNINSLLVFATTIFAAFYMYYKFKNERMKNKHFKKLKKEDDEESLGDS